MIDVDTQLMEKIDRLQLSERASGLREELLNCKPRVASERARLAMEAWKETEGEAMDLRRAKLLKRVLEGVPVVIFPRQLLAGSDTKYFRGADPHCDYDGSYLTPLLKESQGKMTLGGPVEKGILSEEDYVTLIEAVKFWHGKTAAEKAREVTTAVIGPWYDDLVEAGCQRYESLAPVPSVVDNARIVNEGIRSFIAEAENHIHQWIDNRDTEVDRLYFWQATIVALEAVINFARRYSKLAKDMATAERDPWWQAELENIAETCQWVPENPARNFREAIQSIVICNLAQKLETGCSTSTGWGLVDQYLYPYFKRDLDAGKLTLDEAGDLVSDLLLCTARKEWVSELSWRDFMQKQRLSSISLGGPDRQGEDTSNELTYLVLHMMGLDRFAEPHIVIRWHKKTPRWLMRKALETNLRVGGGVPQFQNAEHIIQYLVERGVSLEDARCFQTHGCSQGSPADSSCGMMPSYINVALCIDLALHNGVASKTGKRLGLQTGDPRNFNTFDEFYSAFKKQVEYVTRRQLWRDSLIDRVRGEMYREPLSSALLPGGLKKGRDFDRGGLPHYRVWYKKDRGLIPAADSLVAVKKVVYDEKRVSMGELLEALDTNFRGEKGEEIRQLCLAAPKYGNDCDEADNMVRDVAKFSAGVIMSEKNIFGWPYAVNRDGQAWHYKNGKALAALPNGRRAGDPLPDGSLSAMQGMDRNGPTALLNSALKADFKESAAAVLNLKFPAALLHTNEMRDKVASLTESFFTRGGSYVQYNILDARALKEAKRNPEKYKDLVVRVGGYSAYFVNLSPEVQDEIIRRTEHEL